MAEIVFEILTRGAHSGIYKADHFPVTIGRALSSDIVIGDPYISPNHALIDKTDTGWMIRDCDSTNGTFIGRSRISATAVPIAPGSLVTLGKTTIRVCSADQPVAPALPLERPRSFTERITEPVLAVLSIGITLLFTIFIQFASSVKQTSYFSLFAEALPWIFFPLIWAGLWSFVGFIIRHRGKFSQQLIVSNSVLILVYLLSFVAEYLDYISGSTAISNIFQYVVMTLTIAGLLFVNLKISSGSGDAKRALVSLLVAFGAVAAIAVTDHSEKLENKLTPEFSQTIKPYTLRLIKPVSLDDFLKESSDIFAEKDADTAKQKKK